MAANNKLELNFSLNPVVDVGKINVYINALKSSLGPLAKDINPINEAELTSALKAVESKAKGAFKAAGDGVDDFGDKVKKTGKTVGDTGGVFQKAFAFNQIAQSVQTFTSAFDQFLGPYQEFDKQLKNIGTLGVQNFEEFRSKAIELASGVPDTVAGVTESVYNAISAGAIKVTNGVADVAGGMQFIEQSSKLAVAGLTDTNSAVKSLAANLNAYGESTDQAARYSDILFNTVNQGVTTIPELNASLSNVIPTAAAMQVPFEEVTGAIASMTKMGTPTAQATTQIRQALVEIQKPGADLKKIMDAAGVSMESLKNEGLQVTMEKLGVALEKAGLKAGQVFGSVEAANAVLGLSGENAKNFASTMETYMTDAAGSTERAFALANTGIGVQTQGIMNQIEAMAFKAFGAIGDSATGILTASSRIAPLATTMASLGAVIPTEGIKNLATSLVSKLVPAAVTTNAATGAASVSFKALWASALGPIALVVGGIAAVAGGIYLLSDALHESAEEKKADMEAEKESINLKQAQNLEDQKRIKTNNALIAEYEKLGKKVDKTKEEQQRFNDVQNKLRDVYPGVIKSTADFKDNLHLLNEKAEQSKDRLEKLKEELQKLGDEERKIEQRLLANEIDIEKKKMEDLLTGVYDDIDWKGIQENGVLGAAKVGLQIFDKGADAIFGSSSARNVAEKFTSQYMKEIYNAENTGQIRDAADSWIKSIQDNMNLAPEDENNLVRQIRAIREKAIVELESHKGIVKENIDENTDANNENTESKNKLSDASKEVQREILKEYEAIKNENDVLEKLWKVQDKISAQAAGRKVGVIEEGKALERNVNYIEAEEKALNKVIEKYKVITTEAGKIVTSVGLKDDEAEKLQKAIYDMKLKVQEQKLNQIELDIKLNDLKESQIKELNEGLKNKLKIQFELEAISPVEYFNSLSGILSSELDTLLNEEGDILDDLNDKSKSYTEAELRELRIKLNTVQTDILEKQKEINDARSELDYAYENQRLSRIKGAAEYEREVRLNEARKTYKEDIQAALGNEAAKFEAFMNYQSAKQKIEEDYLVKSSGILASSLLSTTNIFKSALADAFSVPEDKNAVKNAEKNIDAIKKEQDALRVSLSQRKIDREDYVSRKNELDQKLIDAEDALAESSVSTFEKIKSAAISTLDVFAQQQIEIRDKLLVDIKNFYSAIESLEKEKHKTLNAAVAAEIAGEKQKAEELYATYADLTTRKDELTKQSEAITTQAYATVALQAGASFAKIALEEKKLLKATVLASLDALQAVALIMIAEITAKELASKSLGGFLTAAGMTAAIMLAVSAAKAAASKISFKQGGKTPGQVSDDGKGGYYPWRRTVLVEHSEDNEGEFIVNAKNTKRDLNALKEYNALDISMDEYILRKYQVSENFEKVNRKIDREIKKIKDSFHSQMITAQKNFNELAKPVIIQAQQEKVDMKETNDLLKELLKEFKGKKPKYQTETYLENRTDINMDSRKVGEKIDKVLIEKKVRF